MYDKGIILYVNQTLSDAETFGDVKKIVNYALQSNNYDNFKLLAIKKTKEEEDEENIEDEIVQIVLVFTQDSTSNERDAIVSFVRNLSYITKIEFWEKEDHKPTLVRNADLKLIRVILNFEDLVNYNAQEVINNNPLVSKVDTYPVKIMDIQYNNVALGYTYPVGIRDINGRTYQEATRLTPASAVVSDILGEISNEDVASGYTKSLKITPLNYSGKFWLGFRFFYGVDVVINNILGKYKIDGKLEIEYLMKFKQLTHSKWYRFHNLVCWVNSKTGRFRYRKFTDYPDSDTFQWVNIDGMSNPFDWYTWKFVVDFGVESAYPILEVYRDNVLITTHNPGALFNMTRKAGQIMVSGSRTNLFQGDETIYLQYVKATAYSKLRTG